MQGISGWGGHVLQWVLAAKRAALPFDQYHSCKTCSQGQVLTCPSLPSSLSMVLLGPKATVSYSSILLLWGLKRPSVSLCNHSRTDKEANWAFTTVTPLLQLKPTVGKCRPSCRNFTGEVITHWIQPARYLLRGTYRNPLNSSNGMLRRPLNEEQNAQGWAMFQRLMEAGERHLADQGTQFLVGDSITMAVRRAGSRAPVRLTHSLGQLICCLHGTRFAFRQGAVWIWPQASLVQNTVEATQ